MITNAFEATKEGDKVKIWVETSEESITFPFGTGSLFLQTSPKGYSSAISVQSLNPEEG
jgi:hypothetical protein